MCLVTLGSTGDVHPMLALGTALKERGHRAVVLTNPVFEGMAAVTKFTKTYDITKMDKMEEAGTNFVSDWHIEQDPRWKDQFNAAV